MLLPRRYNPLAPVCTSSGPPPDAVTDLFLRYFQRLVVIPDGECALELPGPAR